MKIAIFKKYILIFIILIGHLSCKNNSDYKLKKIFKDCIRNEILYFRDQLVSSILFDDKDRLLKYKVLLLDSTIQEINFDSLGMIKTIHKLNLKDQQINNSYYFYNSGNLKNILPFKEGKKYGVADEYYDITGYLKTQFFYDTSGSYYFSIFFLTQAKNFFRF
ncbi:MAG: hypothetical protein IPG55_00470 [Saprospiraceae bacterium]|nr:hypothetical protein [Candidatus Defluviibacterium haderslevense]